jgi:Fe-S cluster biogenesis protein NfuA
LAIRNHSRNLARTGAGDALTPESENMSEEISFSYRAKDRTRIRVTAQPSPVHHNVCRFVVEPPVFPGGAAHFSDPAHANEAPLAKKLLGLDDVREVLIAEDAVTVTTENPPDWNDLSTRVSELIRDQINSGTPSISDAFKESIPAPEVIREQVQEVLDTAINPAVAAHGGFVTLLDVRGNTIYLEFGGGCQGCGMVNVTLKYGVEKLVRERVPVVGEILDTTDHASGRNPYYAPSAK